MQKAGAKSPPSSFGDGLGQTCLRVKGRCGLPAGRAGARVQTHRLLAGSLKDRPWEEGASGRAPIRAILQALIEERDPGKEASEPASIRPCPHPLDWRRPSALRE